MTARRPRLLMLDNIDSFTFMLVDYLLQADAEVRVARSSDLSVAEALNAGPDGIVISPGPGTPEAAGISIELAAACIERRRPMLGVCLGHQALARACGSEVVRTVPMHGKVASVRHDGSGLLCGLTSPFAATRYHSLAVPDPRPPLIANAWSDDGTVMAMRHADAPAHGVQFHPESIASEAGLALIESFVALTRQAP